MNNFQIFALGSFLTFVLWGAWIAFTNGRISSGAIKLRLFGSLVPMVSVVWPWYGALTVISPGPWLWFAWVITSTTSLGTLGLLFVVINVRRRPGRFEAPGWATYLWMVSGLGSCVIGWIAAIVTIWFPVSQALF